MAKKVVVKANNNSEYNNFLKEIEKRSYELYLERIKANTQGNDLSDWLKAETEIKQKMKMKY